MSIPITIALAAAALFPFQKGSKSAGAASKSPEVGAIAPALQQNEWLNAPGGVPDLAKLRGKVVVVTTYGYYCDSCTRVGIPTANALRLSNPEELCVIGITGGWNDEDAATTLAKAKELGIEHAIALADYYGGTTPYLDLNVNPSLTCAFVIGKSGALAWKGDPSRDREEYVDAVSDALRAVPTRPLPASMAPELNEAVKAYAFGDFERALAGAQTVAKKLATKTGADAERARKDAEALADLVEGTRKDLLDELERATGDHDPERYSRAMQRVRRAFPKGPTADRASQLEMHMTMQTDFGPKCKAWADWFELEAERPATFPLDHDKTSAKFAKQLSKYLAGGDVPGAERGRAWLTAYEAAKPKR